MGVVYTTALQALDCGHCGFPIDPGNACFLVDGAAYCSSACASSAPQRPSELRRWSGPRARRVPLVPIGAFRVYRVGFRPRRLRVH